MAADFERHAELLFNGAAEEILAEPAPGVGSWTYGELVTLREDDITTSRMKWKVEDTEGARSSTVYAYVRGRVVASVFIRVSRSYFSSKCWRCHAAEVGVPYGSDYDVSHREAKRREEEAGHRRAREIALKRIEDARAYVSTDAQAQRLQTALDQARTMRDAVQKQIEQLESRLQRLQE
jgi:hypothetical protein